MLLEPRRSRKWQPCSLAKGCKFGLTQCCPNEDHREAEGCSLHYVEKDGRYEEYGNCEDGGNGPRNGA